MTIKLRIKLLIVTKNLARSERDNKLVAQEFIVTKGQRGARPSNRLRTDATNTTQGRAITSKRIKPGESPQQ